jgi:hypothetical protein
LHGVDEVMPAGALAAEPPARPLAAIRNASWYSRLSLERVAYCYRHVPEWSARSGTRAAESVRVGSEVGLHILAAHDIAINQYVAAGMLTSQGHRTSAAANEAEAIDKIK